MKNIAFYKILICFGLFWLTYSCEKSADQTTTGNVASNGQLTNRWITACNQCSQHHCCCGIELQNPSGSAMSISICGTADGSGSCMDNNPPSPCTSISGGGQSTTLSSGSPKVGFCLVPGNSFLITNTGGIPAVIKITCHDDITNPTYVYATIPVGGTYYWASDSGCDLSQCH